MAFFHCILIFVAFDFVYKIIVSVFQVLIRHLKSVFAYLFIHSVSSAILAYSVTPFLAGKSTFVQILVTILLGIWACSGVAANSYKAKQKAQEKKDYAAYGNSDNRSAASLIMIILVPVFFFILHGKISPDGFLFNLAAILSKSTAVSIVFGIIGALFFFATAIGIVFIPGALFTAFSMKKK